MRDWVPNVLVVGNPIAQDGQSQPAQEKAFTDKYKTAFEAKDTGTLELFLYTQGADPEIVGFYK